MNNHENKINQYIEKTGFTETQLLEKIKKSNPYARLTSPNSQDYTDKSVPIKIEDVKDIIDDKAMNVDEVPQPTFKPQFQINDNPENLQDFLKNFYALKQNEIHVIINSGRSSFHTQDFFQREMDKIKLVIENDFNVSIRPNLIFEEQGKESKELTCIQISIPFEGDVKNWRYMNLLEIIPKSENINVICQFNQTESKLFEAEIVIDSNHIEYMIKKFKQRIFEEEQKLNQEYAIFLQSSFNEIEKQQKKSEMIQKTLFNIKKH